MKKEDKTREVELLTEELVSLPLEAIKWRTRYDINSIADCTCASEEELCGFLEQPKSHIQDMSSHIIKWGSVLDMIDIRDEAIFYGFRTRGKMKLMQVNGFVSSFYNQ